MTAPVILEERLPETVERGTDGGPTIPGVESVYLPNGQVFQNFLSTTAVHKYNAAYGMKQRAEFNAVRSMFYVVKLTPYAGFRFRDWGDYQATQLNSRLALIDGDTWQLQLVYTFGTAEVLRDIYKPVDGTVVVYDSDGNELTSSTDPTTGIATVTGSPASWEGEFDVPVYFKDDAWASSLQVNSRDPYLEPERVELWELK